MNQSLNVETEKLVDDFAKEMKAKLLKAQIKYGYSDDWKKSDWEDECKRQLHAHVAKGDPLDVAAYSAFMHFHGWNTKKPIVVGSVVDVDFVSESRTEFSGKRFTGKGVIDRIEDGRVYGRLNDGTPFLCMKTDVSDVEEQSQ